MNDSCLIPSWKENTDEYKNTKADEKKYDIQSRYSSDQWTFGRVSADGKYNRPLPEFSTPFGDKEGELPVEAGRYRLIWAPVCPWAHRSIIVRELLGLQDAVSVGKLDPKRPNLPYSNWAFTLDPDGVDPVLKIHYLSEAYHKADPDYHTRFSVPAVVDLRTGAVVQNDFHHLTLYWETAWKPFHKKGAPELYPEDLRKEIDELNEILFNDINNGVYKCGFAKSQQAYENAYDQFFLRMDSLERKLSGQRFLFGEYITESDIRLYVTLARFDKAYFSAFNVNARRLTEYPNLWGYARDLYQTDGFGSTTDFRSIKIHYHLDCRPGNLFIPKGPELSIWKMPQNRKELSIDPEHKFRTERTDK